MPSRSMRAARSAAKAPSPGPPARPGLVLSMRTISASADSSFDMTSSADVLIAGGEHRFRHTSRHFAW